jgi:circadian clock protein KaiC
MEKVSTMEASGAGAQSSAVVQKMATGIYGFDSISGGGVPEGRTTLVSGAAGSGKTVFAAQFLVEGIRSADEPGVFVTFEESPTDICRNMLSFGWDIAQWERDEKWRFVNVSSQIREETVVAGQYDLGGMIARVENAVHQIGAKRVALDSLGAVFSRFDDHSLVRDNLFRLALALKEMGVTSILTAERANDGEGISRHGVEEYVADNVVILRNSMEGERRRRTIEILKFRGATHRKGQYPFTVDDRRGIMIVPLSAMELKQKSSNLRITSGNSELDQMCDGGFFRDSIVLVSGATGTGKTLMVTEFIAGGVKSGERCLLFAFEESREQLFRNATGWGVDFQRMEKEGRLKVICEYPEVSGLEERLVSMQEEIHKFKPNRVAVDSLSALERVASSRGFREFVIGLTSDIKHREVAGLFTATTPTLMGGTSVTEAHISTLTDSIILLRYVEMYGEMRRGVTLLKMRGSQHEKDIREFTIDHEGMHIGRRFQNVIGILAGHPAIVEAEEVARLGKLFQDGESL